MKIPRALLGVAALLLAGCATPIKPAKIEVSRYMGPWRVIACTNNPIERKFVDATEAYSLADPTHVNVIFTERKGSFDAPVETHHFRGTITSDPSIWKMHFSPLFTATYIVGAVAPDYSWAIVVHPSRKYGWLLARDRTVSATTWAHVMDLFGKLGYDTSIFIKIPQPSGK